MRCPKCGFISFDHVEACLKCSKDISKTSSGLEGTTYNVAPPSFLKIQKSADRSQGFSEEIQFDHLQEEQQAVDPDLDVLVDEQEDGDDNDADIAFGDEFEGFGSLAEEEEIEITEEDDGEELGLDLGQFEDAFEEEEPESNEESLAMDMPDELADISDLSPPAGEIGEDAPASPAEEGDDLDEFNLDLDLDDLDNDDFSLTTSDDKEQGADENMDDLSLDDLGLSDSEEEPPAKPKKKERDAMDMDGDLNFDLDLGGITLDSDDD